MLNPAEHRCQVNGNLFVPIDSVLSRASGERRHDAFATLARCASNSVAAPRREEPVQLKHRTWITTLSVAAILIGSAQVSNAAVASFVAEGARRGSPAQQPASVSASAARLREDMRKLWSDHVIWTREYIVAAIAGSPDANAAATRLLKNQDDIGGAVAGFYGKDAGDKLTGLLKQHILIAVDLIAAAKANDQTKYAATDQRWKRNGEAIADFLSQANPNWPKATLASMMATHLATTTKEVVARLNKKWDEDTAAFDEVYTHILHMADALSDGIINQFPQKF